jgi:hypothetical protein
MSRRKVRAAGQLSGQLAEQVCLRGILFSKKIYRTKF